MTEMVIMCAVFTLIGFIGSTLAAYYNVNTRPKDRDIKDALSCGLASVVLGWLAVGFIYILLAAFLGD